jgi:G3E family GTPase
MLNDFDTDDLLSARRDDVTPEDERTVSDLMVDQIEFAEVIVLNKTDMVNGRRAMFGQEYLLTAQTDRCHNQSSHCRPYQEIKPQG